MLGHLVTVDHLCDPKEDLRLSREGMYRSANSVLDLFEFLLGAISSSSLRFLVSSDAREGAYSEGFRTAVPIESVHPFRGFSYTPAGFGFVTFA